MTEVASPPLSSSNQPDAPTSRQIRDLCADVLDKAREFTKAVEFRAEPAPGAREYWEGYRARLATYDRDFDYPGSVNPIKCALKGWKWISEGVVQCVECHNKLELTIPDRDQLSGEELERASLNLLKSLRSKHDNLCPYHAAFHHSIMLHSVSELEDAIRAKIPQCQYRSDEIANEFANLCDVAVIEPSFSLYFAIAGWTVTEHKTLFCNLCLQEVNPAEHQSTIMDPLKLHYPYCLLLEAYPQWKLALEEFVYMNSNPLSISENYALIQRQLKNSGLLKDSEPVEETPSVQEEDAVMLDINRTRESIMETRNESMDMSVEAPQLRDTDFEAEIRQQAVSRKRAREEIETSESPLAKRAHQLPFPNNYLAAYGQPVEEPAPPAQPPATSAASDRDLIDEILSPEPEDLEELAQSGDDEALDRLPVHEAGERGSVDSEDEQSLEPESYPDDEPSTEEEEPDEQAPYNEADEFSEHMEELHGAGADDDNTLTSSGGDGGDQMGEEASDIKYRRNSEALSDENNDDEQALEQPEDYDDSRHYELSDHGQEGLGGSEGRGEHKAEGEEESFYEDFDDEEGEFEESGPESPAQEQPAGDNDSDSDIIFLDDD